MKYKLSKGDKFAAIPLKHIATSQNWAFYQRIDKLKLITVEVLEDWQGDDKTTKMSYVKTKWFNHACTDHATYQIYYLFNSFSEKRQVTFVKYTTEQELDWLNI